MKYTRREIDPGPFKDIMPQGARLYERPELPTIHGRIGQYDIKVTDLRCIRAEAEHVITLILKEMANFGGDESEFKVDTDNEELVDLVNDIITSFRAEITKRGKKGWVVNVAPVYGVRRRGDVLTYELNQDFSAFMKRHASKESGTIDFIATAIEYAKDLIKRDRKKMARAEAAGGLGAASGGEE